MAINSKKLTWATTNWAQKAVAIGVPLCLFCFSGAGFFRSLRSLESLDIAHGVVSSSQVIRLDGRTRPFAASFSLQNSRTVFGVHTGQNQKKAELLTTQISLRTVVTIYYDASGAEDDGINLHIYQVRKGPQIIYGIDERHSEDLFMANALFLLGLIFSFWISFSMRAISPESKN